MRITSPLPWRPFKTGFSNNMESRITHVWITSKEDRMIIPENNLTQKELTELYRNLNFLMNKKG